MRNLEIKQSLASQNQAFNEWSEKYNYKYELKIQIEKCKIWNEVAIYFSNDNINRIHEAFNYMQKIKLSTNT